MATLSPTPNRWKFMLQKGGALGTGENRPGYQRTRWIGIIWGSALLLSGCGHYYADWATHSLPGRTLTSVKACAGLPEKSERQPDGSSIVEWSSSEASASIPLSLPIVGAVAPDILASLAIPSAAMAGQLSLPTGGGYCRMMLVVGADGIVRTVHFAGPGDSLSGANALCGQAIVRGCGREALR